MEIVDWEWVSGSTEKSSNGLCTILVGPAGTGDVAAGAALGMAGEAGMVGEAGGGREASEEDEASDGNDATKGLGCEASGEGHKVDTRSGPSGSPDGAL